jgi:hypothetical protein
MSLPKFSEILFRINNPGVSTDRNISESATYSYDDMKAPGNASLTTGHEADDINYKSVAAHMTSKGVPPHHVKAIVAHLKQGDGYDDSDKKGYDVKSYHGKYTVHSTSSPDTGISKFHVQEE